MSDISYLREFISGMPALEVYKALAALDRIEGRLALTSPRGGEVMQAVVSAFSERQRWSVAELRLRAKGASQKEVYNAVGYLARKGKIQRLSYGKYAAVAA